MTLQVWYNAKWDVIVINDDGAINWDSVECSEAFIGMAYDWLFERNWFLVGEL